MIRENISYHSFFIYGLIVLGSNLVIIHYTKKWAYMLLIIMMGIGSVSMQMHPVSKEQFLAGEQVTLKGIIIDEAETAFNQVLILDQVINVQKDKAVALRSKIKVITNYQEDFHLGETVLIQGKVNPLPKQYNPSDFDYGLYLKSQGIVNEVKLQQVIKRWPYKGVLYKIREKVRMQIEYIFKGQDDGLVSALVLGEDGDLNTDIRALYEQLGIAHVLAISGLHMSIIAAGIWWSLGIMGLNYEMRNGISLIGIWSYSIFVGMSVSIIRASIMLTIMLVVRSLWEEEDLLSSLALAALIILIVNPFQLYQVGFQLSFIALLGIAFYQSVYHFIKHECSCAKSVLKVCRILLPSICIGLFISPVIAYHFYEIPLLSVLLNVLLVPIFGLLLPLIFITLLVSTVMPGISFILAYSILGFLGSIKSIGTFLATLPFTTLIIGRPSGLFLILHYSMLCILGFKLKKIWNKRNYYLVGVGSLIILVGILNTEGFMNITHLYVGQGDCTVVTTPKGKTLLIDSGPEQSGKKVENYLKYKGKRQVDLAIVSHPHEDHIGGLLYLIEEGYNVKAVIWQVPDDLKDEYAFRLKKLCEKQKIPLYKGYRGNEVRIDDVCLQVLWPYKDADYSNANEASLVCVLKYGEFEELFTGDIGFATEKYLENDLDDLEILKVPHHGSSYSSSSKFLEKLSVEYGMISAGVRNLYGHPNRLTLERLKEQQIEIMRTDIQGALFVRTDGKQYTVQSQIQEE
ncbi:DNA internalization-related competence protein ComEC/Rec2 [Zhenhengia yiwuensis]|uniref:DNA internalization-related competence protein ComEC/Rec2 n=1 Tax=Zhenhengia yiwuensis TaxID=2763666 RepID=A0A926EFW6_9FIRM|nr:DNA internalization-related competence protein ComEC/Rec2 [Zhenhengia yiwuensis]MBC8580361.1 DNA internalization-related competence protein ComEC/Rec2 [Zhenhengia yiwuensis]MBS5798178.1 DNA internalization-related competence protein ComEC/Rec2 [Clostridiales bacterium]